VGYNGPYTGPYTGRNNTAAFEWRKLAAAFGAFTGTALIPPARCWSEHNQVERAIEVSMAWPGLAGSLRYTTRFSLLNEVMRREIHLPGTAAIWLTDDIPESALLMLADHLGVAVQPPGRPAAVVAVAEKPSLPRRRSLRL